MKNKFKYISLIVLFIVLTISIIKLPQIYFKNKDRLELLEVNRVKLNLSNIYDNYSLSNADKARIIRDKNINFSMTEESSKEKLRLYLDILVKELSNIDDYLVKLFENNLYKIPENSEDIFIQKAFMSSNENESLAIRVVYYSVDDIYGEFVLDAYDNTLLMFHIGIFNDKNFSLEIDEKKIRSNYSRYLNVSENSIGISYDERADDYAPNKSYKEFMMSIVREENQEVEYY